MLHHHILPEQAPADCPGVREVARWGEPPPRGVYEDTEAFAGTKAFNVYRGDGIRIGRWEALAGITDEQLLSAFDSLLERKGVTQITMLPSGEASS